MKRAQIIAVLLSIALASILTATASAMYNPTLGRFMQRDPLGYVDGMDLYDYEASRPTVASDALGLEAALQLDPQDAQALKVCEMAKRAMEKYINEHPDEQVSKFGRCAQKAGLLGDPMLACGKTRPGTAAQFLADPKPPRVFLSIENFKGFSTTENIDGLVSAYLVLLRHEFVHAIDSGTVFSQDRELDEMFREARGYAWGSDTAPCECKAACDRAWASAGFQIYGKVYLKEHPKGFVGLPQWLMDNRDRIVGKCKAACGKDASLKFDKMKQDCDNALK